MLQNVEITILAENRVRRAGLRAENGLSLFISTSEGDYLFDTGARDAFLYNAETLDIDLGKKVDKIIFSHGHHDHTGGIYAYLKKFGKATVICHYNIFNRKFRVVNGGRLEVGLPYEEKDLVKMGGKFIYKTHPFHLTENILTTGEIPRITDYEKSTQVHQQMVLQDYITDDLHDDMALVIKTRKGLIILLGDCHSGPVNTVRYAAEITETDEIYAILGGMNLVEAPIDKIQQIVNGLREFQPRFVVPLHSTGFRAMNQLYNTFGPERVLMLNTGDRFKLY